MKNRIRSRLLLYFLCSFLVFSVVIGLSFYLLFSEYNTQAHKEDLEARAVSIAESMSGYFEGSGDTSDTDASSQESDISSTTPIPDTDTGSDSISSSAAQSRTQGNGSGNGSGAAAGPGVGGSSGAAIGQGVGGSSGATASSGTDNGSGGTIEVSSKSGLEAAGSGASGSGGMGAGGANSTGSNSGGSNAGGGQGYGSYLKLMDAATVGDIWIVDPSLNQITIGHGQLNIAYKDLPAGAESVILRALDGEQVISESFGDVLGTPTITAAAPILLANGDVAGVVLLHEQIGLSASATNSGLIILLICLIVGVIVSLVVARLFAGRFTEPLEKMKLVALQVSEGGYQARTGIRQADEIGELALALDEMTNRLELASHDQAKLEQLRRDFVANVSHELRTPVTVIKGSLEAIRDGLVDDPDRLARYHQQMLLESSHLERLVSDLLDLSRLQNPDFDIQMAEVSINDVLEDVVRGIRQVAVGKDIDVTMTFAKDGVNIQGDYVRLRQLFLILLDNAIKFSPAGSRITVEMVADDHGSRVAISDQGCGIAEEELPFVFERFHKQLSEENKSGSGLGLSIAKEIALRHGMTITLEANQPIGTRAVVTVTNAQTI